MLVIYDPLRESDFPSGCIATIGNFDGMHVGHQKIINTLVTRARAAGRPAVVITFQPHPLAIVAPQRVPKQVLTLAQKIEMLDAAGVDALLVIPFTHEFSRLSAEDFISTLLVGKLGIREVLIGQDFCFGAGRQGNLHYLREKGTDLGFAVIGIEDVTVRGVRVSSSVVRRAIAKGSMRTLQASLRRSHFIDGRVETGRRLGRKMGVPTVNIEPQNELFPGSGVYVTTCHFETFDRVFEGVTNIGVRPTLYENYDTTIESHILDFDSNVYGDTVRLFFHKLLRRERQFRSALELTNQIRSDIDHARAFFLSHPTPPAALTP